MAMSQRGMFREVGTAVAVLAIYVLTLLLPVHQAAGLQRDLSRLGFDTAATWSVCAGLAEDADGDTSAPQASKCPAASLGKSMLGAAPTPTPLLPPDVALPVVYRFAVAPPHAALFERQGQPRAPPVPV